MQNRKRDSDVQNRLLDSVGEGEGGMFRENSIDKYTIKGETDHHPRLEAWDKCSGLVHWEDPEGWGTRVNPWLIPVNVWQKPLQYCKVISLQLIKINEKKSVQILNGNCLTSTDLYFNRRKKNPHVFKVQMYQIKT